MQEKLVGDTKLFLSLFNNIFGFFSSKLSQVKLEQIIEIDTAMIREY